MKHWNQKHWDYDENGLLLEDPGMWWKAIVRHDGCFELYRAYNKPFSASTATEAISDNDEDCDQMHICDVDELIELLQSLKNQAMAHYGIHWSE